MEMPFSEDKKIDSVLGFELESQIPFAIEELLHDYVVVRRDKTSSQLLVAAARQGHVRELLGTLEGAGVDPRTIAVAPLAYAPLGAFLSPVEGPTAIVDIGHVRTNVCVLHGGEASTLAMFARTLLGGGDTVTRRFKDALGIPYEEAEAIKHNEAALPGAEVGHTALHQRLAEEAALALAPLARDLRQTLAAAESRDGARPTRVVICGGGARLRGMAAWLEGQVGLRVEPLSVPVETGLLPADLHPPGQAMLAQALGLALRGAERTELPDLRQRDLAYRGDVSVLRGKLFQIAVSILVLLGLATANGFATLAVLRKEREILEPRLRAASTELFGTPEIDGAAIERRLKMGDKAEGPPIAEKTALDVIDEISRHTPPSTEVRLDVQELEIKPKKTYLKATTDSAASVDALVAGLEKSPCVSAIQKGRISDVGGQAAQKQFTLTIETKCF
jgi:general secretion pathway protein L